MITKTILTNKDKDNIRQTLVELFKLRFFRNVEVEARRKLTKENYKTEIFTNENIKIDEDELNTFVSRNTRDIEYILSTAVIHRGDLIFTDESKVFISQSESLRSILDYVRIVPSDSENKEIHFRFFIHEDLYKFNIHIRSKDGGFNVLDTIYIFDHYPTCEPYVGMSAFTLDLYRLMCDRCNHLLDIFGIDVSDVLFFTLLHSVTNDFNSNLEIETDDTFDMMANVLPKIPEVYAFMRDVIKLRDFWHYTCPNC